MDFDGLLLDQGSRDCQAVRQQAVEELEPEGGEPIVSREHDVACSRLHVVVWLKLEGAHAGNLADFNDLVNEAHGVVGVRQFAGRFG